MVSWLYGCTQVQQDAAVLGPRTCLLCLNLVSMHVNVQVRAKLPAKARHQMTKARAKHQQHKQQQHQ